MNAGPTPLRAADAAAPAPRWRVRYRDLSVPEGPKRAALRAAFERMMDHGVFIMGGEVSDFEDAAARYCGVPAAVGAGSGTSALYLALRALGVGKGDEVIVPGFTWLATYNAVIAAGATPVPADVTPDLLLDPAAAAAAVSPRTAALLPVHFTGRLCDMAALGALAERHGLAVLEDAAQAFGASRRGVMAGAFGDAGAFSLNPMKVLPAYGDAGLITLRHEALVPTLESLRYLGTVNKETCVAPELNHKIDSLQAAFLGATLPFLDGWVDRRMAIAAAYADGLRGLLREPKPPTPGERDAIFFDYTVRTEARDALLAHLTADGIEAKIKHPHATPDQPAYADLPAADVPEARLAAREVLSLPIHERLTDANVADVIASVRQFFGA